jgi:hypothetical protein
MEKMQEKRAFERKPLNCEVGFEMNIFDKDGVVKSVKTTGYGLDISSNGIGMITSCLFEKGEVIGIILPENLIKIKVPVLAEVMWARVEGEACRAGFRFLLNKNIVKN